MRAAYKLGKCSNGLELGKGQIIHCVDFTWSALCGTVPGSRSAGWSSEPGLSVNCVKCQNKLLAKEGLGVFKIKKVVV